jgi:adenine phosphoribosyltransferase
MNFKSYIESVPNFPKKGIIFRDIQPLLENSLAFKNSIKEMGALVSLPDVWVGVESRGFIFASALSVMFGGGVCLIRKKGKLPNKNLNSISYGLEYGLDTIQMKSSKIQKKAIIVDDVLATGGTINAAQKLCEKSNYKVLDILVLIDLGLNPSLSKQVKSLIRYE